MYLKPLYITRARAHNYSLEAHLRYSIAKSGVEPKLGQFVNWVLHVSLTLDTYSHVLPPDMEDGIGEAIDEDLQRIAVVLDHAVFLNAWMLL